MIDGENNCIKVFGIDDSYNASLMALVLAVLMIVTFVSLVVFLAKKEFDSPSVQLVSSNNTPNMDMSEKNKFHLLFTDMSMFGAQSGTNAEVVFQGCKYLAGC